MTLPRAEQTWMKTDWTFGDRIVRLTVNGREAVMYQIRDVLANNQENPQQLEKEVLAIIEQHRPELKGGWIYLMKATWNPQGFEFWYCHPSLPARDTTYNIFDAKFEMPLIPLPYEPTQPIPIVKE